MSAEIVVRGLTKVYDGHVAVDDLSFTAPAGALTGFVGANGAGKTTTIRSLLGLVEPTSGQALIGGHRYRELKDPRRTVGAVLDVPGAHPGHTGRAHLEILASAAGVGRERVSEVLHAVELTGAADRRVGGYSLGMRQRLSLAAALLGDPRVLILDEPTKGLDPPGIRWLRSMLRRLADEGRCVLMSSHQLDELEAIADRVVIINQGRLVAEEALNELLGRRNTAVVVTTPDADGLAARLTRSGATVGRPGDDRLIVSGMAAPEIGELAASEGIVVHGLAETRAELEEVFFGLTARDSEEVSRVADHRQ